VTVLVLVGVIAAIALTARWSRRRAAESDVSICPGCATPNPVHATFCRKCGKRLSS
jgi:ribosomal protein L40E